MSDIGTPLILPKCWYSAAAAAHSQSVTEDAAKSSSAFDAVVNINSTVTIAIISRHSVAELIVVVAIGLRRVILLNVNGRIHELHGAFSHSPVTM